MAEYDKGRYYWIKLTDRFMTSDTVDFLMSQKDGANYVVLYQMLCLKTVNNNGIMARALGEMIVPFDVDKIQRDCKWFSPDTVRVALELYKKLGLVYENKDGVLAISNFDRLIGSQTYGAEKKELQRLESGQKADICPPEKDIKRIRDKEIKKEDKENKKKKEIQEFPEVVLRIFNHWKLKAIFPREELTETKGKAIQKALKSYSEEEITSSIDRYSTVIFDKSFYFKTKWYIETFMSQGNALPKFTESGERWQQYLDKTKELTNKVETPKYSTTNSEDAMELAIARAFERSYNDE